MTRFASTLSRWLCCGGDASSARMNAHYEFPRLLGKGRTSRKIDWKPDVTPHSPDVTHHSSADPPAASRATDNRSPRDCERARPVAVFASLVPVAAMAMWYTSAVPILVFLSAVGLFFIFNRTQTKPWKASADSIQSAQDTLSTEPESYDSADYDSVEARRLLQQEIMNEGAAARREVKEMKAALESGVKSKRCWYDCGKAGVVELWLNVERHLRKVGLSTVVFECETSTQVPEGMNLVTVHPADGSAPARLTGGMVFIADPLTWPLWVLFCKEATILHRWSPGEMLIRLNFNVLFISVEVLLYIVLVDDLEKDGSLCGVVAGANRIRKFSRAGELLGIRMPKKSGDRQVTIPVDVDYALKRVWRGDDDRNHHMSFVLSTDEHCPADWMVKHIFTALANNSMPMLAKSVAKAEAEAEAKAGGSAEASHDDADGQAAKERVEFWRNVEQKSKACVGKRSFDYSLRQDTKSECKPSP